jgi:hypothetical protein
LNDYSGFKKDPDIFLEQVSDHISGIFEEELMITQLRSMLIRFLELCLSKLAWSPDNCLHVWDSTKGIAHHLHLLLDNHIIDDLDDLDDMYWSLIHRMCVFIDLFANDLPDEFYTTACADIANKKLILTTLEEQQDWLINKADFLQHHLHTNKARMLAYQNGILVR